MFKSSVIDKMNEKKKGVSYLPGQGTANKQELITKLEEAVSKKETQLASSILHTLLEQGKNN